VQKETAAPPAFWKGVYIGRLEGRICLFVRVRFLLWYVQKKYFSKIDLLSRIGMEFRTMGAKGNSCVTRIGKESDVIIL
jgi:hypothetical protein